MSIVEIIKKKKEKFELTEQEIDFIVKSYVIDKSIADYHISALLMAFRLNGMTNNEIYYLTKAFINTSKLYQFDKKSIVIDKHSSGGVGDKITLIIQPILMALGFGICKISGRGLGHTGGTIDKLDAINFNSQLNFKKANEIFKKTNSVLLQQTDELVPADKLFYALRDVTSTIDTDGLIISSILSKKFVINSDYIFIDLKVGSGAIIANKKEAKIMANKMLEIASMFNRKLFIHLTNMDQPLGNAIGNAIEVIESVNFLNGKFESIKLKKFIYKMLINILILTKVAANKLIAKEMIDNSIKTKNAYNYFLNFIKLANGQYQQIENNKY